MKYRPVFNSDKEWEVAQRPLFNTYDQALEWINGKYGGCGPNELCEACGDCCWIYEVMDEEINKVDWDTYQDEEIK